MSLRRSEEVLEMPEKPVRFEAPTNELRKQGQVVGTTDRVYEITGDRVLIAEVLVRGDLSGELEYNGRRLRIVGVHTITGLKVTLEGARGPVWEGVECEVVQ
jgi:hypothetical protein